MEKLADNLQRLSEDDLLQVVQLIHDNKAPDTYTKNDVERRNLLMARWYGTNSVYRGRIPRGPLYITRCAGASALGFLAGEVMRDLNVWS